MTMDPNKTLRELRNAVASFQAAQEADALDTWLSRGGFLPDAWERESESGDFSERDWWR